MRGRCKPTFIHPELYFEKGIKVCDEWLGWETFYNWATANGYTDYLELDRKDSNKGYYPDNCRWVTEKQQSENIDWVKLRKTMTEARRSENHYPVICVEKGLQFRCYAEAAEWAGVSRSFLRAAALGIKRTAAGYHWKKTL